MRFRPLRSRLLLSSVCLALFPTVANSERKPVALGLLGGMNVAALWGQDVEELNTRFWPTTGFSLAFHLPQFLGLEFDMLYASRGSAYRKVLTKDTTQVNTFKAHSLTFPVLLKLTAPVGTEVQPFFFGGPAIAYFFSKNSASDIVIPDSSSGMIRTISLPNPVIATKDMAGYEILLVLGGGLEWGLGTFQLRTNLGQNTLDLSKKVDVKTVTFDAMASFVF